MIYLNSFNLPSENDEINYLLPNPSKLKGAYQLNMECYSHTNVYPFKVFINRNLPTIKFSDITIFYGSNGSGKSTLLNLIGEKLNLKRSAPFNDTPFFTDYANLCKFEASKNIPKDSKIITSDDVFDRLLDIRSINQGIEHRRQELFQEYESVKEQCRNDPYLLSSLDDYDKLKRKNEIRFKTKSKFTSTHLNTNEIKGRSNGENAFAFFTNEITENALYLLDEPENSLSPKLQLDLIEFLMSSVRFYGCQFVISTHSPFLLSMTGAKIYDLDSTPIQTKKWTELENIKVYLEFFGKHSQKT